MTTMLDEQVPAPSANARPGGTATTVRALARAEAGRLLRHPAVLVPYALYLAWVLYSSVVAVRDATSYPVVQYTVQSAQLGMLAVAAGTVLAAHLAASRPERDRTAEFFDVLLMPAWHRTAALLTAVVPLAAAGALLVVGHVAYVAAQPTAVGVVDVAEVLTAPAVVLFGGVAGILLARCTHAVVAGPLLVVALAALIIYASFTSSPLRWSAPVVLQYEPFPLPGDLIGRPAGWHLLYLVLLTASLASASLAVRRTGREWVRPGAAAGVALLGALAILAPQAAAPGQQVQLRREVAMQRPAAQQECRQIDATTYCAFSDFTGRVAAWADMVRAVRLSVPGSAHGRLTAVRQRINTNAADPSGFISSVGADPVPADSWRIDDIRAGTPGTVPVGTGWGDGQAELDFAASVAYRLVTGTEVTAGPPATLCGGRAIVILWLAAQASGQTREGFDYRLTHSTGGLATTPVPGYDATLLFGNRETTIVQAVLSEPADTTRERVMQQWTRLVDPGTTTEQAAKALGVPAGRADEHGQCR